MTDRHTELHEHHDENKFIQVTQQGVQLVHLIIAALTVILTVAGIVISFVVKVNRDISDLQLQKEMLIEWNKRQDIQFEKNQIEIQNHYDNLMQGQLEIKLQLKDKQDRK